MSVNQPEAAEIDASAADRFASGDAVGEEARRQCPDGVLADLGRGLSAALLRTQQLIAGGRTLLFEATFEHDGVAVQVDILERDDTGAWTAIEVKSAGSAKPYHHSDLATQLWVLEANDLVIADAVIRHIDTRFMLMTPGDYAGLFADTSLMSSIRPLVDGRRVLIEEAQAMLAGGKPDIAPGPHCHKPFDCPFAAHCQSALPPGPEWPVTVLPGGGGKTWLEMGVEDLLDVPREALTSPVHQRVYDATVSGVPYHDVAGAKAVIDRWELVRTWLDFETIGFVIPRWVGTRPYQGIPFQFSAQIEQPGDLEEVTFLDLSGDDPRRGCAEALAALPTVGDVVAYNAGFERGCILSLAAAFPDLARPLQSLADRLVDLLPVTRKTWYHRDQRGSWSIKAVLPTVAPEMDYSDLAVGNGMEAQAAYLEATDPATSPERKSGIGEALLTYCGRDTEAMMVLARHLVTEPYAEPDEHEVKSFDGPGQLELVRGEWYGMTMWPGYGDSPYHSPIRIDGVDEIAGGVIDVRYYDPGYAAGVQNMEKALLPVAHHAHYLIGAVADQPGRTMAIVPLTHVWVETHLPMEFAHLRVMVEDEGLSWAAGMTKLIHRWTPADQRAQRHPPEREEPAREEPAREEPATEEPGADDGAAMLRRQPEADAFTHLRLKEGACAALGIPHVPYPMHRDALDACIAAGGNIDVDDLLLGLMHWLDVTDDPVPAQDLARLILDAHYPPDNEREGSCTIENENGVPFSFRIEPSDLDEELVAWQREDYAFAFGHSSRVEPGRMAVGVPIMLSLATARSIFNHGLLNFMNERFDSFIGAKNTAGRFGAYYNRDAGRTEITPWDNGYRPDGAVPETLAAARWLSPNQIAMLVHIATR